MTAMIDNDLGKQIRNAFGAIQENEAPPFDDVWRAAERRYRQSRRRYVIAGGVAAALAIVTIGLWSVRPVPIDDEYLIADALLNHTQWSAPSDVLLPEHEYDVYREVPSLTAPTEFNEGSLL